MGTINNILSIIVILIALGLTFILIFNKESFPHISGVQRIGFEILLCLYAIFRGYRIYKTFK